MIRVRTATFVFALAAMVGGCSAHDPLPRSRAPVTMGVPADDGSRTVDVRIMRDDIVPTLDIPATRAALWTLVPAVYAEVGLAEPALDRAAWTTRLQNHTALRRIGTHSISSFLDCGSGQSGPHANTRRIRMTVETALESLASGDTRVHTRVDAVAISLEGASAAPLQCTSRGVLEQRINYTLAVRAIAQP